MLAALFVLSFGVLCVVRISFPFEIGWMESGILNMVNQLLKGQSLYQEPTAEYVAFGYPPLYFQAAAALSRLLGASPEVPDFLPLRLVSVLSSLGVFALAAVLLRRRGLPWLLGLSLAAVTLASYERFECWHDNARVDALFGLLLFGALSLLCEGRGRWSGLAAGVVGGLAVLTKQPAAPILLAAWLVLTLGDRSIGRLLLGGAACSLTVLLPLWASGELGNPWFYFFLFKVPASHAMLLGKFVRGPLFLLLTFPALLFAAAAGLWLRRRRALLGGAGRWERVFWVMLGLLLVMRAQDGASPNFFLPLVPVMTLAAVELVQRYAQPAGRGERWLAGLCLAQLLILVYNPLALAPTEDDLKEAEAVVRRLRVLDGPVLFTAFPSYAVWAGKPWVAQQTALLNLEDCWPGFIGRTLEPLAQSEYFAAVIPHAQKPLLSAELLREHYPQEEWLEVKAPFLRRVHHVHFVGRVLIRRAEPAWPVHPNQNDRAADGYEPVQ